LFVVSLNTAFSRVAKWQNMGWAQGCAAEYIQKFIWKTRSKT